MKILKSQIYSIILIFILTGCGYKLLNYSSNFKISEIKTQGDNRINFILKNKIDQHLGENKKNNVKLSINSSLKKIIKEKNIKNEITKYEIKASIKVDYIINDKQKVSSFVVSETQMYNVAANHSQTLINEKNSIKLLLNSISEKINKRLLIELNDF